MNYDELYDELRTYFTKVSGYAPDTLSKHISFVNMKVLPAHSWNATQACKLVCNYK